VRPVKKKKKNDRFVGDNDDPTRVNFIILSAGFSFCKPGQQKTSPSSAAAVV
jgi:hypothetical protein